MNRPVQRDGIQFFFHLSGVAKVRGYWFSACNATNTNAFFNRIFIPEVKKKTRMQKKCALVHWKSFISGFRKQRKSWFKGSAFFQTQNFEKRVQVSRINSWESCVVFFNRNFLLRFVGFDITVCPFCMLLHPDFERDELSFSIQSIESARFCQECQFQSLWQMVGPSFFWGNRLGGGLSLCFFTHFFWNLDVFEALGMKGCQITSYLLEVTRVCPGSPGTMEISTKLATIFFLRPTKCPLRWTKWRWTWFSHLFPTTTGRKSREVEDCLFVVVVVVAEKFDLSLWKPSVVGFHVESRRATDLA